jgi:TfoX/Sxy family transcriptional regulator of competence genes
LVNFAAEMKANKIINRIFLKAEKKLLQEIDKSKKEPFGYQHKTFNSLIDIAAKETLFGIEHRFGSI